MANKLNPLPGQILGAGNRPATLWQRLIDDQP